MLSEFVLQLRHKLFKFTRYCKISNSKLLVLLTKFAVYDKIVKKAGNTCISVF